jgi:hypothetical protein
MVSQIVEQLGRSIKLIEHATSDTEELVEPP